MSKMHFCRNCGYKGTPKKMLKGSSVIELLLWCLFIIPGIFYTVWRSGSHYKVCPKCKAPYMIQYDPARGAYPTTFK